MPNWIPRLETPIAEHEAREVSPLVLAFVGDSVQTLYERTHMTFFKKTKPHELHKDVAKVINATAQAAAVKRILPLLTEQEQAVYRRGRNSKSPTSAKNASIVDYRVATGYEALVGYCYLTGQEARLKLLLESAYQEAEDENTLQAEEPKREADGEIPQAEKPKREADGEIPQAEKPKRAEDEKTLHAKENVGKTTQNKTKQGEII